VKKIIVVLCLLALLGGVLAACGAQKPEALLAGKWKASVASLEFAAYEFVPDPNDARKGTVNRGKLASLVTDGTYEVVPGKGKDAEDMVKITTSALGFLSATRSYYFTVDAATLTLREEGSEVTATYTRDTGAAAATTG